MTLTILIEQYKSSIEYKELRKETKQHYRYMISCITKYFGDESDVNLLTTKKAKLAYDFWCSMGVSYANHIIGVANIVMNYAVRMEDVSTNPFASVKKRSTKSRKIVWTPEQVKQLLDYAYSDYKWRNLGLIAQMAYEWCQRIGDMRVLTWDSITFDKKRCSIEQSKRRAEVFLPISDGLMEMLVQQHDDFGFQKYIVPRPSPYKGEYIPYSMFKMSKFSRQLIDEAGLPRELRLSDLRRTGTTEMVEAGVGIAQIMSVTGHSNPQSVKPYIKNTFDSANYALTARQNRDT
jgi:integrase|tara:strand:+ start:2777 stop:3649 length:873 start_codon:yes stop_codon:yes gene_type:complete